MCFFCSRISSRTPHYSYRLCVIRLLLIMTVSQTCLVLDSVDNKFQRAVVRRFVDCPSLGIFATFLSSLNWAYGSRGGRPKKYSAILITSYQRYTCQHDITLDVELDHLVVFVLSSFSTIALLLFPLPLHTVLFGES